MKIDEWWPRLDSETQEWLIAHNGDVVPAAVLDKINQVGGQITSEASWAGGEGQAGVVLSDTAIDWIEETANGEA
jgi:hypothetical protein